MLEKTKELTVDEVIEAWKAQIDTLSEEKRKQVKHSQAITDILLKFLAEGKPISPQMLTEKANLRAKTTESIFKQMANGAAELDEKGNLVGLALSLTPTPHHFRVNGKELYAWCSLDTFFLPGLLGQRAEIESTCPVSGETISVTIGPDGVETYDPPETVLSIAVPGLSCRQPGSENKGGVGAESEACSQMHFFKDRQAGEDWIADYPGVAVFTVEEAYRLAKENWLDRRN